MSYCYTDFDGDRFVPCHFGDCHRGDIVRVCGATCQVLVTSNTALVVRDIKTEDFYTFSPTTASALQFRDGLPLPVRFW